MSEFVIQNSTNGQYYFILRAPNGEPILTSETYTTKQNCKKAIGLIREYAPTATIEDVT